MTEERIERLVEALTDSIDRRFLRGEWSQPAYDRIMRDLARWADRAARGSVEPFSIPAAEV